MRKAILTSALLLASALASASIKPGDPKLTGEGIERDQDKMQSGYIGETRDMTLTLISADGKETVRKLTFEGFEGPNRRDKTVMRFVYPADMKGAAVLTHEQGSGDDDQWLFLPAIKRVKRIASSNQSGSFMGSEFSYEDLVVRQFDKYTFKYLGDEVIDGKDCYVIERIPKNKNSGYSKVVRWRMKDNLQELRTDYFDRKGELLKRRKMEGHHLVDGFWRVTKVTVTNVQTNKKSTMSFDTVAVKQKLPEQEFSVQEFNAVQ